jgi:trigger factor
MPLEAAARSITAGTSSRPRYDSRSPPRTAVLSTFSDRHSPTEGHHTVKTAAETLNPTRVRLTVEVGFDEISADLAGAYKRLGQQVAVPGFRRGKVPTRILDQRVGRGAVLEEAVNGAIPKLYAQAVREKEIAPLGRPDIEVTELEDNARLAFTAEVDVRPELELPDLAGVELAVDTATVADDDVDTALDELRRRFATLAGVERPAADGDFVSIDLTAARDGEPLAGVEVSGQSYQVGAGTMIEGLDEAITGLSAGESATFSAALLGEYAGQDADITVTVASVKEQVLPALDDDFAGLASEFDSLDNLRTDTRERLDRQKSFAQQVQAREKLLEAVLERIEVPLPEAVVVEEVAARRSSIEEQLAQANTDLSAYLASRSQSEEEFLAELDTQARGAMRSQFVLDALVKRDSVDVGQEEISSALLQLAQQSGMSPQQYIQAIVANNSLGDVVGQVAREKALTGLLATAVVTDADGNLVEMPAAPADAAAGSADAAAGSVDTGSVSVDTGSAGEGDTDSAEPVDGSAESDAEADATV